MTKTTYKVGDKVRILNAEAILCANGYRDGDITEIIRTPAGGIGIESRTADYPVRLLDGELKYIEKVVEQVAKFKVGDKVKYVSGPANYYTIGNVYEVLMVEEDSYRITDNEGNRHNWTDIAHDRFELVSDKPTKNQRISTLEQAQASLEQEVEALKAEVAALKATQKPTIKLVDEAELFVNGESFEKVKAVPATFNEQRKAIIAEAKAFESTLPRTASGRYLDCGEYDCTVEYIVDENKRTVVALLKGMTTRTVRYKGIAKCAPSDVFNADIGKAIALGRALGLDVSKFEQAVQPSEVVVGMHVRTRYTSGRFNDHCPTFVTSIRDGYPAFDNGIYSSSYDITTDTEAQY